MDAPGDDSAKGGGGARACVLPETDRPRWNRGLQKGGGQKRKNPGKKDGIGTRPGGEKTDRLNQQPAASAGKMSARLFIVARPSLALLSRCHLRLFLFYLSFFHCVRILAYKKYVTRRPAGSIDQLVITNVKKGMDLFFLFV